MNLSYEQSSSLQVKEDIETWLKQQKQYSVLIDGYQKLAVALAFELWKELRLCRAENKALLNKLNGLNTTLKGGDHHG